MAELALDDVRVIKLVNNEVIIGFQSFHSDELDANPELDDYITIQHPYQVMTDRVSDDQVSIDLMQWMPYMMDNAQLLQKHNIIAIGMPNEDLIVHYVKLLNAEVIGDNHESET